MRVTNYIIVMIILACFTSPLYAKGGNGKGGDSTVVLSEGLMSDLSFLREEEKLARDVYLYMYEAWGETIFLNISASEQKHMDAVKNIFNKYGLEDRVIDDTPGEFTNEFLAETYSILTGQDKDTLFEVFEVGTAIEEMDIEDIDKMLKYYIDAPTDIMRVLANLLAGSYNHLDAFENALDSL